MDYSRKLLPELKTLCKERGIRGFSGKKKGELVAMLEGLTLTDSSSSPSLPALSSATSPPAPPSIPPAPIGSRYALSLFSGAGGDTVGLEAAGWRVSHFSEFNAPAIRTHHAAFPHSRLLTSGSGGATDIKQIPDDVFVGLRGTVELIFAGFPCQGFSHAGKKRTDDPRNELVHEFVRAARLIQPTWIIGENVKGLLSRKGVYPPKTPERPVIEIIRELFAGIGYHLTYRVINTVEVGVPQQRKRLIIVGRRSDEYPHLEWERLSEVSGASEAVASEAVASEAVTGGLGIRHLLTSTLTGAVEMCRGLPYTPETRDPRFWIPTTETVPTGTPHPNLVRLMAGQRNLSTKEKTEIKCDTSLKVPYTERDGLISFGTRASGYHGQVLDPDAPSKTIICAYSQCPRLFVGLHNATTGQYWVRCLTPQECGRIQGFAADYPWQGTEKDKVVQIGNAVPPPLATAVARLLETAVLRDVPQEGEPTTQMVGADGDSDSDD
jgi:DNA (cytosine-5)-methyltransferase 1